MKFLYESLIVKIGVESKSITAYALIRHLLNPLLAFDLSTQNDKTEPRPVFHIFFEAHVMWEPY